MSTVIDDLPIFPLQREAAQLLADNRGGIAWWRVGQGKTRIALAAFWLYPTKNVTSHLLVFCRPESFPDWQRDTNAMGLTGRVKLQSYASLSLQSGDAVVRDVLADADCAMVCFDELYLYKNPSSIRSERAHQIAERKPCVGLSGSIMTAQRLEDVYGQAKAVNKHRRIAPNLTRFRTDYLMGIQEFGAVRWAPKRGAYAALMDTCASFAHVYMPKKSDRLIHEAIIDVVVTSQQDQMFRDLQDTLMLPEQGIQLSSAASMILKVQQIADGWVYGTDAAGDDKFTPVSSNKPKALFAKLDELLAADERVIVWCGFRYDVLMLHAMAEDRKLKSVTMLGGDVFDLNKWNRSQVCFATVGMGSSVNHFSQVRYAIYYSLSQKWLDFQQSMGRTDRKDSQHSECFYYHLHVRNSLDANVLRRVRQAGSSEKGMLALAHDMRAWLRGDGSHELVSEKEIGGEFVTSQDHA